MRSSQVLPDVRPWFRQSRLDCACLLVLMLVPWWLSAAETSQRNLVAALENTLLDTLLTEAIYDYRFSPESERAERLAAHLDEINAAVNTRQLDKANQVRLRLLEFLTVAPQHEHRSTGLRAIASTELERLQARLELPANTSQRDYFAAVRGDSRHYIRRGEKARQQYLDRFVDEVLYAEGRRPWCYSQARYGQFGIDGVSRAGTPIRYEAGQFHVNLDERRALPLFELPAIAAYFGVPGLHGLASLSAPESFATLVDRHSYLNAWAWYLLRYSSNLSEPAITREEELAWIYFESLLLSLTLADIGLRDGSWDEDYALQFIEDNTPYHKQRILLELASLRADPGARLKTFASYMALRAIIKDLDMSDPVRSHDYLLGFGIVPPAFLASETARANDHDRADAPQAPSSAP